jgi:hypothetical protein
MDVVKVEDDEITDEEVEMGMELEVAVGEVEVEVDDVEVFMSKLGKSWFTFVLILKDRPNNAGEADVDRLCSFVECISARRVGGEVDAKDDEDMICSAVKPLINSTATY